MFKRLWVFVFLSRLFVGASHAQLKLPPQPTNISQPSIRELADGRWMVGAILLDKKKRRIEVPARVNMPDGLVEYVLVHSSGKTHESLLITDVQPYHVQIAMLLLGAKGANFNPNKPPQTGPITNSEIVKRPPITGTPTLLSIQWNEKTNRMDKPIDQFIFDKKLGKEMPATNWNFTGSVIWEGAYIAQIEGSIIALITDMGAIFNSQLPNRDADSTWYVRSAQVPRTNVPVTLRIQLDGKKGK